MVTGDAVSEIENVTTVEAEVQSTATSVAGLAAAFGHGVYGAWSCVYPCLAS